MRRTFPFLALALLLVVAVAGLAAAGGQKMTICHVPPGDPSAAKTKEISSSAWSAHKGHGDHKGPCTGSEGRPSSPQPPPPPPPTRLSLSHAGEGDVDGSASFRVEVSNGGPVAGRRLHVEGNLLGEGEWTVRAPAGAKCETGDSWVVCDFSDLAAGRKVAFGLSYEGGPTVCRSVGLDLRLTAANDASTGDDHAEGMAKTGACSPLPGP